MALEQVKDYILNSLKDKVISLMHFVNNSEYTEAELGVAIEELLDLGLITRWAEDGWGTYRITDSGELFVKSTSFTRQREEKEKNDALEREKAKIKEDRSEIEFNWKKRDEKRKNTTLVFGLIAGFLAIWNGSIQYINWKANWNARENTKVQIDSIKDIVSLSQLRIDSLSNIVNASSTKKATANINRDKNTKKDISIPQN